MNKDKDKENEIREKLNEGIDKDINNLLVALLAKFMLDDIDNDDMEVANDYLTKIRIMLLANKKNK